MSVIDFCDKLEGFYDNWYQAAGNPAKYAHIKLRWERIGHHQFKSKQWYHYLGEENPYRSLVFSFSFPAWPKILCKL